MATVEVQSDSDPSTTYSVDPEAGTCTCKHYTQKLKLINEAEGKALACKHVAREREKRGETA